MCQQAVVHVSQQKSILTHLAQAAELLLLLKCDSGIMAHESGNNGKCGMFWLILRSRFHFPCNNFMNQKGKCVMLSVHLELYIFRALCKHFFCTSDFLMGGAVCSEVRTVSTTSALLSFIARVSLGTVVR